MSQILPSDGFVDASVSTWTCPFCPLLCDDGPTCAVSRQRLALLDAVADRPEAATPRVAGQPVTLAEALAAATTLLRDAGQPLIAGWGTDVAGARALYRLACASGAISDAGPDAAASDAQSEALRALQDRGGYTTTLAELRERAELIVFIGSWAPDRAPRLLERALQGRADRPPRLVHLGLAGGDDAVPAEVAGDGFCVPVERRVFAVPDAQPAHPANLADLADLADLALSLKLAIDRRPGADPMLATLAGELLASPYAVLVWEPGRLGPHAALVIERLQQVIARLNATTRAAALPIGGAQGMLTAQQVHAWLSGLPLRSRVGPRGLEHDPLRYGLGRLLDDGSVDALVWTGAFPAMPAPDTVLPRLLLVSADVAATPGACGDEAAAIVIPVASPGVQHGGHLFRTDTVVLMPLHPSPTAPIGLAGLPSVARVVGDLLALLEHAR
ncbi:formylmethanofuran dehydrogenase [Sphaerotilus mobilis]|uniref:Formylmethanofuran dehydrogenase subunit B n=1 Tax=Sphaerotilus mobilis TaxID=47994 RepID=A0A4V2EVE4_9BURK|nr:formylmethanofuran dehydrogenase [Sphaerotilus mobilis]RZS52200.1 formylmethanofuran dehydrogenase subunit B [Sphaerotilus mobilis]